MNRTKNKKREAAKLITPYVTCNLADLLLFCRFLLLYFSLTITSQFRGEKPNNENNEKSHYIFCTEEEEEEPAEEKIGQVFAWLLDCSSSLFSPRFLFCARRHQSVLASRGFRWLNNTTGKSKNEFEICNVIVTRWKKNILENCRGSLSLHSRQITSGGECSRKSGSFFVQGVL